MVHNDVEAFGVLAGARKNKIREDRKIYKIKERPFYVFKYLSVWNYVYTFSCFIVKKELLNTCKFDLKFPHNSSDVWLDWWLLGQLSVKGKFFFQSEKKTKWRVHGKSYIRQAKHHFGTIENARSNIISNAADYLNGFN